MAVTESAVPQSRAVRRRVVAGCYDLCPSCGDMVKFSGRNRGHKVICNVYEDGVWDRVEHWHEECYADATPYGDLAD